MKHLLLTTIAAVLLVGCGPFFFAAHQVIVQAPDISIHDAARQGKIKAVKKRLAAGVDVHAKNKDGYTPLHVAARSGRKEIAELLIAEGADVNAKDGFGGTPLGWAIRSGHTETADLLRKHGGKTGEELKAEGK